jgi:hypothetical protein
MEGSKMRVLTQFENNIILGGCDLCGGKAALDPKPIVGGVLGSLATGAGVGIAGFGIPYIGAGVVLGAVAGVFAAPWLSSQFESLY